MHRTLRAWARLVLLLVSIAARAGTPISGQHEPGVFDPLFAERFSDFVADACDTNRLFFCMPIGCLESYFAQQLMESMPAPSDAPVNAVFSGWQATLEIGEDATQTGLEMTGNVFRATAVQPVMVPLFREDTVFEDLKLNGREVSPLRQDNWFAVPLHQPGGFGLSVRLAVRPEDTADGSSIVLSKPPASVSSVRIDSDANLEARIDGVPGVLRGAGETGTHGTLAAGSGDVCRVRWRESSPPVERTGTPSVSVASAWVIGDRVLAANMLLETEIMGGSLDRIALALPAGADKVKLQGTDVRESRYGDGLLEVFLRGRIRGRTVLRLSFELPREEGSLIRCPLLGVRGGRLKASGWLLVAGDAQGALLEERVSGLRPVADLEVPPEVSGLLAGRALYLYERTARRPTAEFDLVSTTPFPMVDTIADLAEILCVIRPDGEEITRTLYTVRNNRRQFLRLRLPQDASLLSVMVENRPCAAVRDGGDLLLPLVKSVQTLDGLISFPVEIVTCRRGDPLGREGRRTADFPDLLDVPVAFVKATVLWPETIGLSETDGALRLVKRFDTGSGAGLTYGHGYSPMAGMASRAPDFGLDVGMPMEPENSLLPQDAQIVMHALARNYFEAGYDAYRANRLEEAEDLLSNADRLGTNVPGADDARNLLTNIRAGRGDDVGAQTREVRAKVQSIQKGLQAGNVALEARQEELIGVGLSMIRGGKEELGAEMLKEAQSIGGQLTQRSASQTAQRAVASRFSKDLEETERRQETKRNLQERLSGLQSTVQELAAQSGKGASDSPAQGRLAQALDEAAVANKTDLAELQTIAFSSRKIDSDGGAEVDKRVRVQQWAGKKGKSAKASAPSVSTRRVSLDEENTILAGQVAALEQAVSMTQQAPQPGAQPEPVKLSGRQRRVAGQQLNEARDKAEQLKARLSGQADSVVQAGDKDAEKELGELSVWAGNFGSTYTAPGTDLDDDLAGLRVSIDQAKQTLAKHKEKLRKSEIVQININDVVRADSRGETAALNEFLFKNYGDNVSGGGQAFTIRDGVISVVNEYDNVQVLTEAAGKFRSNRGMAVGVAGRNVKVPMLGDIPLLGSLFSAQTGDGRRYAVLDEAQYRTLRELGDTGAPAPANRPREGRREVIVGTPNKVAGESFALARGGADYNGLVVGGTEIRLPHGDYLAIDNGGFVTVIKAGEVRNWHEADASEIDLGEETSLPIELPRTGAMLLFEKALLAAGESPDVTMIY